MNLIERFLSQKLTLVERQHRLTDLLGKYPITNETIWWFVIVNRGFLTAGERDSIVRNFEIYKDLDPNANTSVSNILDGVHLQGFSGNKFLSRVCFNYDRADGAAERRKKAMEDLQKGIRNRVDDNDTDLWTMTQWVKHEFDRMQRHPLRVLNLDTKFNREVNAVEKVYHATSDGITDYDVVTRDVPVKVFPLLDVTEIIKPPPLTDWQFDPKPARVAKLFGDGGI